MVTDRVQGSSLAPGKPTLLEPCMAVVLNLVRTGGGVMADLSASEELAGENSLPVCGCGRAGRCGTMRVTRQQRPPAGETAVGSALA